MLRFTNHGVLCELPETNSGNALYMDVESYEVPWMILKNFLFNGGIIDPLSANH